MPARTIYLISNMRRHNCFVCRRAIGVSEKHVRHLEDGVPGNTDRETEGHYRICINCYEGIVSDRAASNSTVQGVPLPDHPQEAQPLDTLLRSPEEVPLTLDEAYGRSPVADHLENMQRILYRNPVPRQVMRDFVQLGSANVHIDENAYVTAVDPSADESNEGT